MTAPEEKRKIIGDTFMRVAEKAVAQFNLKPEDVFLAQGTLRPDLIESASTLARCGLITFVRVGLWYVCLSLSLITMVAARRRMPSRRITMTRSWCVSCENGDESSSR